MENRLVIGILNIVEDKLREFGVQLPDDDREDSQDPIVGYQYAELHDRIHEYLQEEGILPSDDRNIPKEDFRQVFVLSCVHETRHGDSFYGSVHPSYQAAMAHVGTVQKECDFEESEREFFNFDIEAKILDVSKLTIAQPLSITQQDMQDMGQRAEIRLQREAENEMRSLASQINFAESLSGKSVSGDVQKEETLHGVSGINKER